MTVIASSFIPARTQAAIAAGFLNEVKKADAAKAATDAKMQMAVDAMTLACTVDKDEFLKGNAATNPHLKEVAIMFDEFVKSAGLSTSARNNYKTSFWIAFKTGVPYMRTLFERTKEKKASAGRADDTKAGKVTTTTDKELVKTLAKALEQMTALNRFEQRATLLDLILEIDSEFKV